MWKSRSGKDTAFRGTKITLIFLDEGWDRNWGKLKIWRGKGSRNEVSEKKWYQTKFTGVTNNYIDQDSKLGRIVSEERAVRREAGVVQYCSVLQELHILHAFANM